MGKTYSGGVVEFTITGPATVAIPAMSISVPTNAEITGNDEGEFYDGSLSLTKFQPVFTVTTKNVGAVLDLISLAGQCVGSGLAVTQVDFFYRRQTDCQTSFGETPHIRDRVVAGLLVLNSVEAAREGDATISFTLYALSTGGNAPVARTDGVALPSTISRAQYALGIPSVAGVELPEIENLSIAYNVAVDIDSALGSIWPDVAGVRSAKPVISLRQRDLSKVTAAFVTAGFDNPTHADTKLQFIKRLNAGTFGNFASSIHILMTAAGMLVPEDLASISANQRGNTPLRLQTYFDGTNAPITVDTTAVYDSTPA